MDHSGDHVPDGVDDAEGAYTRPDAAPRWLRKRRQAARLAVRFGLAEGETVRKLGPGFYVRSSRALLEDIARKQGTGPIDLSRFTWADGLTDEEWTSFMEAIEEMKGRPLS
jgi:hypothetical protein